MRKCVCDFNDATNTKEEIRKSLSLSGSMLAEIKSITTLNVNLYKLLIKEQFSLSHMLKHSCNIL